LGFPPPNPKGGNPPQKKKKTTTLWGGGGDKKTHVFFAFFHAKSGKTKKGATCKKKNLGGGLGPPKTNTNPPNRPVGWGGRDPNKKKTERIVWVPNFFFGGLFFFVAKPPQKVGTPRPPVFTTQTPKIGGLVGGVFVWFNQPAQKKKPQKHTQKKLSKTPQRQRFFGVYGGGRKVVQNWENTKQKPSL